MIVHSSGRYLCRTVHDHETAGHEESRLSSRHWAGDRVDVTATRCGRAAQPGRSGAPEGKVTARTPGAAPGRYALKKSHTHVREGCRLARCIRVRRLRLVRMPSAAAYGQCRDCDRAWSGP